MCGVEAFFWVGDGVFSGEVFFGRGGGGIIFLGQMFFQ